MQAAGLREAFLPLADKLRKFFDQRSVYYELILRAFWQLPRNFFTAPFPANPAARIDKAGPGKPPTLEIDIFGQLRSHFVRWLVPERSAGPPVARGFGSHLLIAGSPLPVRDPAPAFAS